jgi:heptosyltransferase-2
MPLDIGERPTFLVLRLSSFGDIVLTESITRGLKLAYPGSHVCIGTSEEYRGIVALFPHVDSIAVFSGDGSLSGGGESLPARRIDVAIDLQNSLRSRSILRQLKPRRILRYRRQYLKRFLAVYLPWVWKGQLKHTSELYLEAVRPLGVDPGDGVPRLAPAREAVRGVVTQLGKGRLVGVCPGASSPYKSWPARKYRELIELLTARGDRVVVVGASRDAEAIAAALGDMESAGIFRCVTDDISSLAAVLSRCTVTVSNDSGLMHLAAAVGSRVVAVFGPTSPILGFAPQASGSIVVSRHLACSPCSYHGNKPCRYGTMACMEEIEAREVTRLVDELGDGEPE